MEKILVIYNGDSLDPDLVRWLSGDGGYEVTTIELPEDLTAVRETQPDVLLVQYDWGGGRNCLSLLNLIKVKAPALPTIVFDQRDPDPRTKEERTRKVKKLLARTLLFDSRGTRFESQLLHEISSVLQQKTAIQIAQTNGHQV